LYKKNACEKGNIKLITKLNCGISGLLWTEGEYKKVGVGAN
jgi:hypothetical protein